MDTFRQEGNGLLRFVVPHPCDKSQDVARMGSEGLGHVQEFPDRFNRSLTLDDHFR